MFFRPDIRFWPKVKNIPSVIHCLQVYIPKVSRLPQFQEIAKGSMQFSREQKKLRELIVKLGSLFLHKTPRPEKNHREFYALALLFPMPIFRLWPTSYIQTAITWQSVNWHLCADNFRYAHCTYNILYQAGMQSL